MSTPASRRTSVRPRDTSVTPATSSASRAARRWAPWGFPVLYIGWAYVLWLPVLVSDSSVWGGRNLVLFLAGGASPLLAGITLALLTGGSERLREIGRRLVDPRRIPARWWLVVIGFWPCFYLLQAGAALLLGVTDRPLAPAWEVVLDPSALGLLLLLSFVFPAVEEIGLRGYWLDRLLDRFVVPVAALVNGAAWATWHAPFVALPGYYADTTFQPELSWWLPMIVCETVLYVWIYRHTDRSLLAVLLFHAMMNLTGELLGLTASMYPFVALFHLTAAAVVMASWWRDSSARPGAGGSASVPRSPVERERSPTTAAGHRSGT